MFTIKQFQRTFNVIVKKNSDQSVTISSKDINKDLNHLYGLYCRDIDVNIDKMKSSFLMSTESGNTDAMTDFWIFYRDKKYLLMAIECEHPNPRALTQLGTHYQYIEKDYIKMTDLYD